MSDYKRHWSINWSSRYGGRGKRTDLGNVWGRFGTLADRLAVRSERETTIKDN